MVRPKKIGPRGPFGSYVGRKMKIRRSPVFSERQAKKLKQMASAEEVKYFDTALGADDNTIGLSATVLNESLVLMQEGDGESNRDGNRCTVQSLFINGNLELPESSSLGVGTILNTALVRIVVVYDKGQVTGSPGATWTDVFQSDDFDSFRNLDNKNRFRILADKRYTFNASITNDQNADTFSSGPIRRYFEMNFPKLNIPIEYDASSGALTDLTKNNILILGITEGQTNTIVNLNGVARVRFLG